MSSSNTSPAPLDDPPTPSPAEARKAGITAFVGTTVEWFDFYIYGSAAALVLGKVFFPTDNAAIGTLAAFGTFWVGFLARPLGGIIFGHFGDKYGRKKSLVATLLIMGVSTIGIGLLPSYATIGAAAPILLILLRMLQGVAVGGEWGGAVLIATEYAPPGKKILYGAFAQQGSPVGNLLATLSFLAVTQLSDAAFGSWGWRLPFLASALLILVGLFIRLRLKETPEMTQLLESKRTAALPITEILKNHRTIVLLGCGAVTAGVAVTYVKTTFALSWATTELDFGRSDFLAVISIALVIQVIVQPFGAVLATKVDLRKAVLLMLLPELILLPLMFVLINTGSMFWAIVGMGLATFPHAMCYSAVAGILSQVFPPDVRYTGISLSYQLSTTIFAGTAPLVSQFLLTQTGSIVSVVILGLAYVLISIVSVLALIARTSGRARHGQPAEVSDSTTASTANVIPPTTSTAL
ncbi:MFS transporter [Kribbia dieselivorans]|uniref:MFS transporter n=1 Tax=Kribbia dieselivorans TaxID=331526 RepID=UPI0008398592|nr:MFS transporter [Kribbia dieselivorans]